MLSVPAQALHLSLLALGLAFALGLSRGLPRPAASPNRAWAASASSCAAPDSEPGSAITFISAAEARSLASAGTATFVDCRPEPDFETGHVAGALHVEADGGELAPVLASAVRSAATVITYCDASLDCERSLRVASLLSQAGARDVRVLEGGLPAWLSRGFPAQSGACQACGETP